MHNRKWLVECMVVAMFMAGVTAAVEPTIVAPAVAAALPAVQETLSFAQEVAAVPVTAITILCLPLGLVECVLSPLPGIEFMSGCRHMGQGILAPFRFVEAVVTLPYDAIKATTGVVNAVPQAAGLGAIVPAP